MNDPREEQYIRLLKSRFPDAEVFWKKRPNPALDFLPCSLVVSFPSHPEDTLEVNFDKGLGDDSSLESDISAFIGQIEMRHPKDMV